MRYAMIALGGALGAVARYQVAAVVQGRAGAGFPWGTFVVNVSGSLVLGFVMTLLTERLVVNPQWRFFLPIGFLGAYTTFSTFEFEAFRANAEGAWLIGGAYLVSSVAAGYGAVWAGVVAARLL